MKIYKKNLNIVILKLLIILNMNNVLGSALDSALEHQTPPLRSHPKGHVLKKNSSSAKKSHSSPSMKTLEMFLSTLKESPPPENTLLHAFKATNILTTQLSALSSAYTYDTQPIYYANQLLDLSNALFYTVDSPGTEYREDALCVEFTDDTITIAVAFSLGGQKTRPINTQKKITPKKPYGFYQNANRQSLVIAQTFLKEKTKKVQYKPQKTGIFQGIICPKFEIYGHDTPSDEDPLFEAFTLCNLANYLIENAFQKKGSAFPSSLPLNSVMVDKLMKRMQSIISPFMEDAIQSYTFKKEFSKEILITYYANQQKNFLKDQIFQMLLLEKLTSSLNTKEKIDAFLETYFSDEHECSLLDTTTILNFSFNERSVLKTLENTIKNHYNNFKDPDDQKENQTPFISSLSPVKAACSEQYFLDGLTKTPNFDEDNTDAEDFLEGANESDLQPISKALFV